MLHQYMFRRLNGSSLLCLEPLCNASYVSRFAAGLNRLNPASIFFSSRSPTTILRAFLLQTLPDWRNSSAPEGLAQVQFCASRNWLYIWSSMYIQANSIHWNLIGRSTTALPPVLSPSSILPATLSDCAHIPAWKNSAPFKMLSFKLL